MSWSVGESSDHQVAFLSERATGGACDRNGQTLLKVQIYLRIDLTIEHQLFTVSLPNFAEGMTTSVGNFPFNALLLIF